MQCCVGGVANTAVTVYLWSEESEDEGVRDAVGDRAAGLFSRARRRFFVRLLPGELSLGQRHQRLPNRGWMERRR